MTEPALSDAETRTLIDYARQRFAAERWPLSPALRAWVNGTIGQRKRRGSWVRFLSLW